MTPDRTTASLKAIDAWGAPPPAWVRRLAEEVDATSLAAVGARIGYGKSALSMVLANRYGAGTAKVQIAVEELLGRSTSTVACPVLGEIPVERCRTTQGAPFQPYQPLAGMLAAACRICPHRTDNPGGAP